jgi:hypothetical protein
MIYNCKLAWPVLDKAMMHKDSITMDKLWLHKGSFGSHFDEVLVQLRKVTRVKIPTGYQDKSGFHFGVYPAEKKSRGG